MVTAAQAKDSLDGALSRSKQATKSMEQLCKAPIPVAFHRAIGLLAGLQALLIASASVMRLVSLYMHTENMYWFQAKIIILPGVQIDSITFYTVNIHKVILKFIQACPLADRSSWQS